jgi:hypothetical protein
MQSTGVCTDCIQKIHPPLYYVITNRDRSSPAVGLAGDHFRVEKYDRYSSQGI